MHVLYLKYSWTKNNELGEVDNIYMYSCTNSSFEFGIYFIIQIYVNRDSYMYFIFQYTCIDYIVF